MKDRFKTLFDHADSGLLLLDLDGRILEHNPCAARLMAVENTALLRRNLSDFLTLCPASVLSEKLRLLRDLRRLTMEAARRRPQISHQTPDHPELVLDATLVPWNGDHAALLFVRELSRREGLQQELSFIQRLWSGLTRSQFQHGFLVDGAGAVLALQLWDDPSRAPARGPEEQEAAARESWMAGLLQNLSLQEGLARAWGGQDVSLPPNWYAFPDSIAHHGGTPALQLQESWCLRVEMRPWMGPFNQPDAVLVLAGNATAEWSERDNDRRKRRQAFLDLYSHALSMEFHRHLDTLQTQATRMKKSAAPGQPQHQSATILLEACAQLSSLLRINKGETGSAKIFATQVDLNASVMDALAELKGSPAHGMTVVFEQGSGLPAVNADPALIKELFLSLGRLARANMPVGGELRISTFPLFAQASPDAPASGAGVSWTDSGVGLVRPNRAETADWLGEPGLRMDPQADCAFVFSVLRRLGAQHELDAAPGRKTTWRIYFQSVDASSRGSSTGSGKSGQATSDSSSQNQAQPPRKSTTSLMPARHAIPGMPSSGSAKRTSSGQVSPSSAAIAFPPKKFTSSPVLEAIPAVAYSIGNVARPDEQTPLLTQSSLESRVSAELAARPTPPHPLTPPTLPPPSGPPPLPKALPRIDLVDAVVPLDLEPPRLASVPVDTAPMPEPVKPVMKPERPTPTPPMLKMDRPLPTPPALSVTVKKVGTKLQVLVADDEETVRDFTSQLLTRSGHEVEAAADGQEALDLFMKFPDRFELVVLDAYMPRLGGLEAYLRMQLLKPDLPVIFVSGYVRGASRKALLSACPGRVQMLQKPFTPEELQKAVDESMNPKPAPVIDPDAM